MSSESRLGRSARAFIFVNRKKAPTNRSYE